MNQIEEDFEKLTDLIKSKGDEEMLYLIKRIEFQVKLLQRTYNEDFEKYRNIKAEVENSKTKIDSNQKINYLEEIFGNQNGN